jgi:Cellulase (glycosyl hydrolase family 5)/Secretion system C-terminal sorting domain
MRLSLLAISFIFAGVLNHASAQRGRVKTANGTVVSDIGTNLRGCFVYLDYQQGGSLPAGTKDKIMRLPVDYGMNAVHLYLEKYDSPTGVNAALCDSLVQYTADAKIYLVITIGCGDRNGSFNYDQAINFWKFYAGRYANKTHVVYEIQNEPLNVCNSPSDSALIKMEADCYNIIRSLAPSTHIMLFSYSSIPHTVPLETDITNLKNKGVNFNNTSIAYHGYHWCVFARQNGGFENNTEAEVLDPLQQKGYSFVCTEFDHDSTFAGDITYSGHLLKFYEVDRKVSWLSFFDLLGTANGSDKPLTPEFKTKAEADGISWRPDTIPPTGGNSNTISVYPNPAKTYFFLRISNKIVLNKAYLRLIDIFGRTVKIVDLKTNTQKIDIVGFASGTYIVQVINQKTKYTAKLLVK